MSEQKLKRHYSLSKKTINTLLILTLLQIPNSNDSYLSLFNYQSKNLKINLFTFFLEQLKCCSMCQHGLSVIVKCNHATEFSRNMELKNVLGSKECLPRTRGVDQLVGRALVQYARSP